MLALALAAAAAVPRLLGGFSVLRTPERLHLSMGFAGGAMIGVAIFETIPEARESVEEAAWIWLTVAAGLIVFALLERSVFHRAHLEDAATNPRAGEIGAGGITIHAFLDGLAIGSAFQVSTELGLAVSVAVLLHAFVDGLNTVTVLLRHGHRTRKAIAWLVADALAPIAGAAIGLLTPAPEAVIGALLGFFGGMFLYLGAGSLLPHAHHLGHGHGRAWIAVAAASGFGIALAAATISH